MKDPGAHALEVVEKARRQVRPYVRVPVALRVIGGLLMMIAIGTVLFLLPGVGANGPLTFEQALFTAVSAVCVTGLTIITPSQDLTGFGQFILLLEIQVGGVGFMVLAIVALRLLWHQVSLVDRLAIRDSLGLPEREQFAPILRRVLLFVAISEGLGALFFWFIWREKLDGVPVVWYSMFHAISGFCGAGFDLFAGLPQYPEGIPRDAASLSILGALIFIGGLGFAVLAELTHWRPRKRLTLHARLGLLAALWLVLVGALAILLGEKSVDGALELQDLAHRVFFSLFQSISTRSAGFALGDLANASPATQLSMIALMFIGAGAASMGGGITTGTFLVLLISVWSYARGLNTPQYGNRTLPSELPRRAAAVLTVSIVVVFVATWLLLLTGNGNLDQAVFEVVSAFATTGLSLSFTTQLNTPGLIIIMLMMIWGRLGALTIILALARRHPPQSIQYPEESILIA
jgi:trk system potassium uptake protein TrkH